MKTLLFAAATLAMVAGQSPAAAGPSTSFRDYVKAREAAHIARLFGDDAGREFLKLSAPRIVGGTKAPQGKWPAQVALLEKFAGNNFNSQYCGGTLVAARFVVTAAHCSDFVRPADVWVLTGTQTLDGTGTRRAVRKITIHPNYNDNTLAFDIAVWELKADVPGITPAKMITKAQEAALASAGTSAFATGWGLTSNDGNASKVLRQVSIFIVSTATCNAQRSYDGEVRPQMICAGLMAGGKDACQGDSGGPLWVRDSAGQFNAVAGIVSWGYDCAARNFPGVYSRVAVLSAWARQVIAKASP